MLHRFLDEIPLCVYNNIGSYFFIKMERAEDYHERNHLCWKFLSS